MMQPAILHFHRFTPPARWVLGGLLLIAALLKGYELATGPLIGMGLMANRLFLALAVEVEGALGLWLVSGIKPRLAGGAAFFCFIAYAAFTLPMALEGAASCGCFGRVAVNPWVTFTLDLAALPAALLVARHAPAPPARRWPIPPLAALALLFLGLGVPGFWVMIRYHSAAKPDRALVALDSPDWVGKPWSLGQYLDVWPQLAQGRWAVLLYSWPCGHCFETVRDYAELARQWQARGVATRVALIKTTPEEPPPGQFDLGETPALQGLLSAPPEWFITSPTLVLLDGGRVVAVAEGEEDCRWDDARFPR